MGYSAKRHDRAQLWHLGKRRRQELAAGVDLRWQRLVLRRYASHRVADPAINQLQSVVGPGTIVASGKAELNQRCIEQVAGVIAGERTTGAISALQSGCEADDQ